MNMRPIENSIQTIRNPRHNRSKFGRTGKVVRTLTAFNVAVAFRMLLALAGFAGSEVQAIPGTTKWAVIKCKFSGQPAEPAFNPALYASGYGSLGSYWHEVSGGQLSIAGTTVYPQNGGWYTLPITLAQAQTMTRTQRIDACVSAAGSDLDAADFYSVIAIVNVPIDSGSNGERVLLDPNAWNASFAAHEMGHVYLGGTGTDHSFDDSGTVYCPGYQPGEYGNGWDIMSAMTFGGTRPFFNGPYGASGPGLNAPNMAKLGWLSASRTATWNGASLNVVLTPLNRVSFGSHLMAKVPFDSADPNHYYTVEFRRKLAWDLAIPQDTVLVHEVRPDGRNYLIRANGGAERLAGQRFVDAVNNVAITVLNINGVAETATVNVGRNEVWVDFSWPGIPFVPELGNFNLPHNTIAEGMLTVAVGGTINFKTGTSSERPTIATAVTLKAYNGPVMIGQ